MSQNNSQGDQRGTKNEVRFVSGPPMQEILPRLWLGDLRAAEATENLRSNNISFVLSVKYVNLTVETREAYRKARISHVHIFKADTVKEDLLSILEPTCDMIEAALAKGKAILVHCALGRSRSATVVIAYVMRHLNMSSSEASVFVQTKRAAVSPNTAFLEQLVEWQNCKFDLQNRPIVDQKPDSGPEDLISTSLGEAGKVQGEQEAKEGGKRTQEQDEVAPPQPTHEVVRAAIKPIYLEHPAMGKKKLLRILNADKGWSIGNKEFRSHLEAIVDEWDSKETATGTETETASSNDVSGPCSD